LWKGKKLVAPVGALTRPTSGRARQAAFDILMHADWAGAGVVQAARVLDVFAGTGAYGLEALSRGAVTATFFENNRAAVGALEKNIAACGVTERTRIMAKDALRPPPGHPHELVLLDPPYGQEAVPRALAALMEAGWVAAGALVVAEFGPGDAVPENIQFLAERVHGKARLMFWKTTP
jgi:16S rRNA (guanine966-N2)-methyltransferase